MCTYTLSNLWKIQDINEEEITDIRPEYKRTGSKRDKEQNAVKWMLELDDRCCKYLEILPSELAKVSRSPNLMLNPLFRFLEREVTIMSSLLEEIRKNLNDLSQMATGKLQPLMELKILAKVVYAGQLAEHWKKYKMPLSINTTQWIADLNKRLKQFQKLTTTNEWQKKGVWLGGLVFPEAFITATRQYVAQNKSVSLDELELRLVIWDEKEVDDDSFLLTGLQIQGCKWDSVNVSTSSVLTNPLGTIKACWKTCKAEEKSKLGPNEIFVPVYLNNTRKNLLFSVKLKCEGLEVNYLYQRGCAIIAWSI